MLYFLAVHSLITLLITKGSAAPGRFCRLIYFLPPKKEKRSILLFGNSCDLYNIKNSIVLMNMQLVCKSCGVLQTPPYLTLLYLLCELGQFQLQIFVFLLSVLYISVRNRIFEEDDHKPSVSQSSSDYLLNWPSLL